MSVSKLAVRVVIGGLFFGHGMQKLTGWFGGGGLEGTDAMMEATDMRPARRNSIAAGVTEAASGTLLAAGLATPVAAAGLIGVMTTAIRKVHGKNGPWNSDRGWEYNAVLIATLTALAANGPGRLSLDAALHRVRSGPQWGFFALAAGVVSSAVLIELGRRGARVTDAGATNAGTQPPEPPEAEQEEAEDNA